MPTVRPPTSDGIWFQLHLVMRERQRAVIIAGGCCHRATALSRRSRACQHAACRLRLRPPVPSPGFPKRLCHDPIPRRTPHRQTLHSARQGRGVHLPRRLDQPRCGDARRRRAGDRDERDERLSRRAVRQDRRPQRPCRRPGIRQSHRRLARRPQASARDAGRDVGDAADRAALAREPQRARRRRPGQGHGCQRYPRESEPQGQGDRRQPRSPDAGLPVRRARQGTRAATWRAGGRQHHDHQPGRAQHAVRHGAARNILFDRRDRRDRRVRFRQGVRHHADGGRADCC